LALFSARKRVVGLDIGSKLIKAVEIEHLKDGYEISNVAIGMTPEGCVVGGDVVDRDDVVTAIRSLLSSSGIKCRNVVTAITSKDVIIKRITVDRMESQELREVIKWEAEQHVPFDIEDVILDFQILHPTTEGGQMEVLLVAAKKDKVEEKIELIYDCGLIPTIVDVDSFALTNAFEYNHNNELSGIKCLMNVGKELTSIIMYKDGILLLAREVTIGTAALTEELQRTLGVDREVAESSLLGVIPDGKDIEEVKTVIFNISERLLRNLERANSYVKTSDIGDGIESLYLSGGGAKIPWLASFLNDKMNLEVSNADPFRAISIREGVVDERVKKEMAPMVMLSIGLAMRRAF